MQKERLRHLMSSAILELWKKETGSRTSVSIDATICITPRNGRTTIIQVSDQFQSSMPDCEGAYPEDISINHSDSLNGNEPQSPAGKTFTSNGRSSFSATPIESSPANRRIPTTTPVRSSPAYQQNNKTDKTMYHPFVAKLNNNLKKRNKSQMTSGKSNIRKGEQIGQSVVDRSVQLGSILLPAMQYSSNNHAATKDDNNNNNDTTEFNAELLLRQRDEVKDHDIKIETTSDEEENNDSSSDLDLDDSICFDSSRSPERQHDGSVIHNFSRSLANNCESKQTNEEVKERSIRASGDEHDDSAIQDMSLDLSYSETNASNNGPRCSSTARNMDRHKPRTVAVPPKTPGSAADLMSVGRIVGGKYTKLIFGADASNQAVVDLSKQQRDSDLSISSPQSYTAQVRDAIRRRLLATNQPLPPIFSPPLPLANGHRSLNSSSLGVTKIDFTPPSPIGVSPLPADGFKKIRDSPYSRSLSLNGATSILWGRSVVPGFVGVKQQDSVQQSSAASVIGPADVKFFLPFSSAQIESMTSASNGMLPSYMTSSQANNHLLTLNQAKNAAMARASLHNFLAGMPGGETLQETGGGAQLQTEDEKLSNSGSGGNELDLSSGGDLQGGDQQSIYRCDYCAKTFLFKSKYHEHLPVHTSARPFQCHLCSRTYKYKYDLRVHLRTHLGIPTKSTVCPFCTDKFETNKVLRAHIRDKHKEQQQIGEKQRAISLEGMMGLGSPHTHSAADSGSGVIDSYIGNGESLVMDLDVGNSEYDIKTSETALGTPFTSAEDLSMDVSSRSALDQNIAMDSDNCTSHETAATPPQQSNGSSELVIDTALVQSNHVSLDTSLPETISIAS